jgi:hypothetical protein
MGEDRDITVHRAEMRNQMIGPCANVGRGFTLRHAIAIDGPIGPPLMNFRGGQAFILAIVPLDQILVHLHRAAEP